MNCMIQQPRNRRTEALQQKAEIGDNSRCCRESISTYLRPEVALPARRRNWVAAGIDEEDFFQSGPRGTHSGRSRCHTWSIRYIRGGSFRVTHCKSSPALMTCFVCFGGRWAAFGIGWTIRKWMYQRGCRTEMAHRQLYFLAYMRVSAAGANAKVAICGHRFCWHAF